MTVQKVKEIYKYQLDDDLVEQGVVDVGDRELYYGDDKGRWWLKLGPHYKITVRDGYAWDGCSPKFAKIGPLYFGTIDAKRNAKASCVHDALYQYGLVTGFPYKKKDADVTFYNILVKYGFKLAGLYHWAVDKFGRYKKQPNTYFLKQV